MSGSDKGDAKGAQEHERVALVLAKRALQNWKRSNPTKVDPQN